MNRRELLKLGGALPMLTAAGRVLAAPQAKGKVLVVFLRGGYDAANLLVPYRSAFYYESRPRIAVTAPRPENDAAPDPEAAIALDADWALHPALKESVLPLYKAGQVAFIPFAGTDDLSRSHFETQDSIELGQALDQSRNFGSGFMNRLAATMTGSSPIAFTDQLPLVFRGTAQIPNMALRSIGKPGIDARQSAVIAAMYKETDLAVRVSEGFQTRDNIVREMSGEMEAASRNAITTKGFELEARRIARLMAGGYNLGFVDVGGWDTHVGEGAGAGYLAGRLEELGRGLAGFAAESGAAWKDTVVVVVSEFGRTFRENGNRGTDHGHGSVYWVLGGSVRGGRVAGEQVRIERGTLFQDRDFPVLNEYRGVLAGLFSDMFALSPAQADAVFPGVKPRSLGLV